MLDHLVTYRVLRQVICSTKNTATIHNIPRTSPLLSFEKLDVSISECRCRLRSHSRNTMAQSHKRKKDLKISRATELGVAIRLRTESRKANMKYPCRESEIWRKGGITALPTLKKWDIHFTPHLARRDFQFSYTTHNSSSARSSSLSITGSFTKHCVRRSLLALGTNHTARP